MSDGIVTSLDRPNPLWRLIWKNWQELQNLAVGLLGVILMIQILISLFPWIGIGLLSSELSGMVGLAGVFPIGISLLVPVLAIGQDRQAGTWNWTSSVPCSPWLHFLGWATVWLIATLTGWLILLTAIPVLMEADSWNRVAEGIFGNILWMLVITLNSVIVTTVAMLWFRDPLIGLTFSGVLIFAIQTSGYLVGERINPDCYVEGGQWYCDWFFWLVTVASWFIFSVVGVWLYDWRWRAGQYFQISWPVSETSFGPGKVPQQFRSDAWPVYRDEPESRRIAQINRAIWFQCCNQFWSIAFLVGVVVWGMVESLDVLETFSSLLFLLFIVSYWGVSVGNSILKQDQYRFFSERGQQIWMVWDFWFVVPAFLLLVYNIWYLASYGSLYFQHALEIAFFHSAVFLCMVLSGLLVQNAIVALGVGALAILTLLSTTAFSFGLAQEYLQRSIDQELSPLIMFAVLVLAWILVWVVARRGGRHWLIYGRSESWRIFAVYGVGLILVGLLFAMVPWGPIVCLLGLIVAILALK